MKKIIFIVFIFLFVNTSVKCQEVVYGEKVARLEKVKYGVEIKAHYFTYKKWDLSKRKYVIELEGFCLSQLLPVDNNYYDFKYENCIETETNVFRLFWNYSNELSSYDIDVFKVEDVFDLGVEYKLEFNYKDQTISFFILPYDDGIYSECFTISKLEIK